MNPKISLCLALVLGGGLIACFSIEHQAAKSKQLPPDLYLHLFVSFVYPEPPQMILSAPIHFSSDFDIPMDDNQHLKGRIEPRNGILFVHFQGGLCSGMNVFDGGVELERRYEPWPQPYDDKAPFICQPHFILSSTSNPKSFLKQQADAEEKERVRPLAIRAKRYYEGYLASCNTNEVRCLWFLQDSSNVGMVMQLNLVDYSVCNYRDLFDHALQGGGGGVEE